MDGDAAARRVETGPVPASSTSTSPASRPRLHDAWIVAAVTFVTLLGAAGFRATPGVLIEPLEDDFGWSRGWISAAISVNLVLFGLVGPFAAALMNRFGLRPVVLSALVVISAGAALTTTMTSVWQLIVLWGVVVGTGSGCLATVLAATVATRWFVARRGLVIGVLTAATATGQIVFLPLPAISPIRWDGGGCRSHPRSRCATSASAPIAVLWCSDGSSPAIRSGLPPSPGLPV